MTRDGKFLNVPSDVNTNSAGIFPISAFIVAGGKGSRLGKLGETTQKCMLNLWGKPVLYYIVRSLIKSGCSKILIAVNHLSDQVVSYFGDGSSFGVEIAYINKKTISTYDAIYQSLDSLSDRILYVHANILFQSNMLGNVITLGNKSGESVVTVVDGKSTNVKHAQMDIDEQGFITKIDLKERNGELPYTFLGVAYYKKSDFVENFQYDAEGNVICTGMVEKVIQQKMENGRRTLAYLYKGEWRHIETEADYNRISQEKEWSV